MLKFMSNTADFSEHINRVTTTTNQLSSWILRTFKSRNAEIMLTLLKSLVIPRLDYCSQLFNPYKASQKQQLEMIQRSFLRKINGACNLNHWEQLQTFKISSLERRRERYQIIYVWKILEGLVPNFPGSSEITPRHSDRRGRSCFQRSLNRSSFQHLRSNSL